VTPMSEQMGVTMNLPPIQPRTRRAHEAARWARSTGHFNAFHEALFRAFFERGADIGQEKVLVQLALDAGLDGEALDACLAARVYEEGVQGDLDEAARLEITGVPAFVSDSGKILSGVQTVDTLLGFVASLRGKGS